MAMLETTFDKDSPSRLHVFLAKCFNEYHMDASPPGQFCLRDNYPFGVQRLMHYIGKRVATAVKEATNPNKEMPQGGHLADSQCVLGVTINKFRDFTIFCLTYTSPGPWGENMYDHKNS